MNLKTVLTTAFLGLVALPAAASTTYDGILFPDGDVSFADKVVDYLLGDGVTGTFTDPNSVIGAPDYVGPDASGVGSFSLGDPGRNPDRIDDALFGFVTVQFTDNSLTTSGDASADLFIFETGNAIERYSVEISQNGVDWIFIQDVVGQPSEINIDGVAGVVDGAKYSFVRVSDIAGGRSTGSPFAGPDIDAIGAISSAPPVPAVPLPAAGWMLIAAMGLLFGKRRRTA